VLPTDSADVSDLHRSASGRVSAGPLFGRVSGRSPGGCRRGGRRERTGIRTHGTIASPRAGGRLVPGDTPAGGPPHASGTSPRAGGARRHEPNADSRAKGRSRGIGELQRRLARAGLADSGSDEARHPIAQGVVWCSATTSARLELIDSGSDREPNERWRHAIHGHFLTIVAGGVRCLAVVSGGPTPPQRPPSLVHVIAWSSTGGCIHAGSPQLLTLRPRVDAAPCHAQSPSDGSTSARDRTFRTR